MQTKCLGDVSVPARVGNTWTVGALHCDLMKRGRNGPKSASPSEPACPTPMWQVSEAHGVRDGTPACYRTEQGFGFPMRGLREVGFQARELTAHDLAGKHSNSGTKHRPG